MKPSNPGFFSEGKFLLTNSVSLLVNLVRPSYFFLESVSVVCVFIVTFPFNLSYLLYWHTVVHITPLYFIFVFL